MDDTVDEVESKKTEIDFFDEPRRVGETQFTPDSKPFGIWVIPSYKGTWALGIEVLASLGYKDPSNNLARFLDRKYDELEDLYLNVPIVHAGQRREMTFLHEDAIFDVLLPQYSTKPIAKEYQEQARAKFRELRKTGVAVRGDVEEKLQDPYEQRKLMLEMLMVINEEQRTLKDNVQELEENFLVLSEKLNEKYISLPNRDRLLAIVHQIHLNSKLSHKEIWNDLYRRFDVPKPKSNLARINFIYDSQVPAIIRYLGEKYKLLSFYMKQEGEDA